MTSAIRGVRAVHRQSGFSLIEAAVALIIFGVAAAGFWHTLGGQWAREDFDRAQSHLPRAEAAVMAFAGIHGRLPCAASGPNGVESCGAAGGFFPYATVGVPEPDMGRLRYRVMSAATISPGSEPGDGSFRALVNNLPIGPPGGPSEAQGPVAAQVDLNSLLGNAHDGMLDFCARLLPSSASGAGDTVPSSAFEINLAPDDRLFAGLGNPVPALRVVSAAQLAEHLGCGPIVAVSGRGQYNAHLAGAIMAKSAQDFRAQLELSYGIYVMEVAEGAWSVANHTYGMVLDWAKFPQTVSAIHAKFYSPELAAAIAVSVQAVVTKAVSLASWGARVSNLARFANNLKNYRNHLRIANRLVTDSLTNYESATKHALSGSISAYFLPEQLAVPEAPASFADASDYGPNPVAQAMLAKAQERGAGLGQGDKLSPHSTLPTDTPPEKVSVDQELEDLKRAKPTDEKPLDVKQAIEDFTKQVDGIFERSPPPQEAAGSAAFTDLDALGGRVDEMKQDAGDFMGKTTDQLDPEFSSDAFRPNIPDAEGFDPETYSAGASDPETFNPETFDAEKHDWSALEGTLKDRGIEIPVDVPAADAD